MQATAAQEPGGVKGEHMGNENGKSHTKPARNTRRLAKIVFNGTIEDAFGKPQHELYEDEADWREHAVIVPVQLGAPQGPPVIGRPPQMQVLPVPIAGYEVRQPKSPTEFVAFFVPLASVRYVRMPHELIEVRDARGDVVDRSAVWCSKADELRVEEKRRADLERGEAAEH
jgi:hypothetical protein